MVIYATASQENATVLPDIQAWLVNNLVQKVNMDQIVYTHAIVRTVYHVTKPQEDVTVYPVTMVITATKSVTKDFTA